MGSMTLENRVGNRLFSLQERKVGLFKKKQCSGAKASSRLQKSRIRPLAAEDRDPLITFVGALPEEDLLFLERDITEPAEVDAWIQDTLDGRVVTLVAWKEGVIAGYATFDRGNVPWMRQIAELRVMVAQSARGMGIGRLLAESAFEMVLDAGAAKVIARMTPEQTDALRLFQSLGFVEEAVLRDHALDANGLAHDLVVLSFHTRTHRAECCEFCRIPVLDARVLDGFSLCPDCYESRYNELGGE